MKQRKLKLQEIQPIDQQWKWVMNSNPLKVLWRENQSS